MRNSQILLLIIAWACVKAIEEIGEPNDHLSNPYCFRFTWIGPKYSLESEISNLTCDDLLYDSKGVPCRLPLVASNNSNLPDTDWMWEQYKEKNPKSIACRLSRGDVCVKYLFTYNDAVENITYMCSKVNIDGEGPLRTPGCVSQKFNNGRTAEVCVCESSAGNTPCNAAIKFSIYYPTLIASMILFYLIVLLRNS